MNLLRLVGASLVHHRRLHAAVSLAVAAATAVLVGALLVGDSVRGSLRHLTLDRLGRIDQVLVSDRFFRADLAGEVAQGEAFGEAFDEALPAVVLRGTLERQPDPEDFDKKLRANSVTVLGVDAAFWKLGEGGPESRPGENEIVLNAPLAEQLDASVGDEVTLAVAGVSDVPADSPLGHKTGLVRTIAQLRVTEIIPAEGLGRFALHPSQLIPLVAFLDTGSLQAALKQPGKVNAILVAGKSVDEPASQEAAERLQASLHPTVDDFGLKIEHVTIGEPPNVVSEYYNLTSGRMLLDPAVVRGAMKSWAAHDPQPVFTYLANKIETLPRPWAMFPPPQNAAATLATLAAGNIGRPDGIPYSTITAVDSVAGLGPLVDESGRPLGPLGDHEIVLNSWAAEQLGVVPGDPIAVTYFEPESTHGETTERSAWFTLRAIVPLATPDKPPTLVNDPYLTPQMPGVTDKRSIRDWTPPFPYEQSRVKAADDFYWEDHRTTPKAFVSLATGQRLWSSRFGQVTGIRVAATEGVDQTSLAESLRIDPAEAGFQFQSIKAQGLAASSGTTPFDALFLGFSFFIIAAALMLVLLLFRLGVEQRAAEIGILMAEGMRPARVRRVLVAEGLIVAAVGSALGVAIGIGYARLMIAALTSPDWWQQAISTPFLHLYIEPRSLVIGYAAGVVVSVLTILWSLRRLGSVSVRRLLAGQVSEALAVPPSGRREQAKAWTPTRWTRPAGIVLLVLAAIMAVAATQSGGEAQIGAFFGSGALVLMAALALVWWWLAVGSASGAGKSPSAVHFSLPRLAVRNGARSPLRSTLTIGLVAAASFLIVAISAFRLDPSPRGAGGYALWATSDQPLLFDLNTADGRFELALDADEALLADTTTVSIRVHDGSDASCLNLYQSTSQPRVLGVSPQFVERGGFEWAASAATNETELANPWLLLEKPLPAGDDGVAPIPVVLDMNTALYSLHLYGGVGETYEIEDDFGNPVRLQVVGLLANSIFQGDLLISEQHFKRLYPEVSGYRLFLIAAGDDQAQQVGQVLETGLGDFGFDATPTDVRLENFMAVQNTYLSTFQSLGGLGLLLGTFGLATVQLRNVFERRGELALMRAGGFRRARLAALVLLENAALLLVGLGTGVIAAAVAIAPHLLGGEARIPLAWLAGTLAAIAVVGLAAGLIAARAMLRAPLLPALRGD